MSKIHTFELSEDYIYSLKQTRRPHDSSIQIYDRKREQTVIFQISYSLRAILPMGWFGSLKNCVLVIVWFDFEKLEKIFCCTLLSNMYACELLKDHIYVLKQTRRSHDTTNLFCEFKRNQLPYFQNPLSVKQKIQRSDFYPIGHFEQKCSI